MRRLMNEPNVRKIIHVNMDAVFASVKQRDGPALRGRPVTLGYAANEASSPLHKARTIGVSTGTVPVSDVPGWSDGRRYGSQWDCGGRRSSRRRVQWPQPMMKADDRCDTQAAT